jgi:nucleotide-binding universal stress UspA family protein
MDRRSIICGVDGSEHVCPVVHVAERLSHHLGAELVLVHVTHISVASPPATGVSYEQLEAHAIETGEGLLRWVKEGCRVRPSRCSVQLGDPARVLLRLSEEQGVEMIVIGTRGRGHLKAAVLGSISSEVATHARCPVVVVPPRAARFHAQDARGRARQANRTAWFGMRAPVKGG